MQQCKNNKTPMRPYRKFKPISHCSPVRITTTKTTDCVWILLSAADTTSRWIPSEAPFVGYSIWRHPGVAAICTSSSAAASPSRSSSSSTSGRSRPQSDIGRRRVYWEVVRALRRHGAGSQVSVSNAYTHMWATLGIDGGDDKKR